jgi:hypothetical protein
MITAISQLKDQNRIIIYDVSSCYDMRILFYPQINTILKGIMASERNNQK